MSSLLTHAEIVNLLPHAHQVNSQKFTFACPVHGDNRNSGWANLHPGDRVTLHCSVGCHHASIAAMIGIPDRNLGGYGAGGPRPMNSTFGARPSIRKPDVVAVVENDAAEKADEYHQRALESGRIGEFARSLGLGYDEIVYGGWGLNDHDLSRSTAWGVVVDAEHWTVPETDGYGNVIGLNRRYAPGVDGKSEKKTRQDDKRGLTFVNAVFEQAVAENRVFFAEGATGPLACRRYRIPTMGIPGCGAGTGYIFTVLRRMAERGSHPLVTLIADNDAKESGLTGAKKQRQAIMDEFPDLCVRIVMPPDGAKDMREWMLQNNHHLIDQEARERIGKALMDGISENFTFINYYGGKKTDYPNTPSSHSEEVKFSETAPNSENIAFRILTPPTPLEVIEEFSEELDDDFYKSRKCPHATNLGFEGISGTSKAGRHSCGSKGCNKPGCPECLPTRRRHWLDKAHGHTLPHIDDGLWVSLEPASKTNDALDKRLIGKDAVACTIDAGDYGKVHIATQKLMDSYDFIPDTHELFQIIDEAVRNIPADAVMPVTASHEMKALPTPPKKKEWAFSGKVKSLEKFKEVHRQLGHKMVPGSIPTGFQDWVSFKLPDDTTPEQSRLIMQWAKLGMLPPPDGRPPGWREIADLHEPSPTTT